MTKIVIPDFTSPVMRPDDLVERLQQYGTGKGIISQTCAEAARADITETPADGEKK